MKKQLLILTGLCFSATAQISTNPATLIHQSISQSVTNVIEVHESDGSIHTDQRIITAKVRDGFISAVVDGQTYSWPVRFGLFLSTNIIAGQTMTNKPTHVPPLPK